MKLSARDVSPKAVIVGGVVDIVMTNVLIVPVAVVAFAGIAADLPPAQRTVALTNAITNNPTLYLASLFLGCAASVLGGWSAARIAKKAERLNGALSSFACVGFGIYGTIKFPGVVPLWQHVAFMILSPALGASGGVIRIRQRSAPPALLATSPVDLVAPTPKLEGLARYVLIANRVLTAMAALILLIFGLVGLGGYARHDQNVILGSVLISVFGVGAILLFFLGARALRAARPRHWVLNAGGFILMLIPVALLLLGLSVSRKGAG